MLRSLKFWLIALVLVLLALGIWALFGNRPAQVVRQETVQEVIPQEIVNQVIQAQELTTYQNQANGYEFSLPETFEILDIGVPVQDGIIVEASSESEQTLYVQHKDIPLVIDLVIRTGIIRVDLPKRQYQADKTQHDLAARYYLPDCVAHVEPVIYLENKTGQSLLVKLEEFCEATDANSLDAASLMQVIADGFTF